MNGGINYGLGDMFDYAGPMFWYTFFFHDSTTPSEKLLAAFDRVIESVRIRPVDQETLDRAITKMRVIALCRHGTFAGFGRANLLASFAMFDDDPSRINSSKASSRK